MQCFSYFNLSFLTVVLSDPQKKVMTKFYRYRGLIANPAKNLLSLA